MVQVLEKKKFNRELIVLAIPLALQQLLNALVGATDALVLGRLTQEAIAGVSLANQISFIMSLFNGAIIGAVGILIAQYWSKEEYDKARRFLGMSIRYVTLISVLFSFSAYFFSEQLMRIFTLEKELVTIGAEYLKIVSFSYLLTGLSQCFLMIMKPSGYAKISVWISAMMVIVDVIADIFLVYGFKGFGEFGANGTAYSTIAVEGIALIWCIIWSCKVENVKLGKSDLFKFSRAFERDIWKLIPGMLTSSLSWGLSISMHSFIIGHLGTDATAAYSIVGVTQQLIQCITHGLSAGTGIIIGGLLGKNELDKAKDYGKQFWNVSAISGIINVCLIAIAGPIVCTFYVLEPQAKTYLIEMLIFMAVYMFAYAYNTIITCGVFPAGGDSKYDAISVVIATWCFAIPFSLLGCFVFNWPVMVVFVVMSLDEIVKVPFIKWRYNKYIWLKNLTTD
ncbi:MAG: MATE family efflux transporter [Clostridia bacterium]|nr:MATE family efflux transporter [Clostridia bacterium]